jgi:tellurite resistance protein
MAADNISHHEALIYVMVTMSAVDGAMDDEELSRIGEIAKSLPVFTDFNEDRLLEVAQRCGAALAAPDGLRAVLDLVQRSLPSALRETAYALAVEVAAVDLKVQPEELRLLELLRDKLEISKLVTAALERGARARYRMI